MSVPSRATRWLPAFLLSVFIMTAATASGQEASPDAPQPIGRFAADARIAFPKFKQDAAVATALDVTAANLPSRSLGLVVGAQWYPARAGLVTFGFGGEMLVARAGRMLQPVTAGDPLGPTVHTQFSALSPQISFNFGAREGWSYISGGLGWSRFTTEREDQPLPPQASRSKTINYGGGARWFSKKHVAFSADLRFYAVNPQEASGTRPAFSRMTLVVMSAGAGFK